MTRYLPLLAAALFVAGLVAAQGEPPAETAVSDRDLSLSKTSVFEVPSPEPLADDLPDPGDGALLPRPFEGAPALVSHAVADYLPITLEENLCVGCHLVAEKEEGEPTPIPESHFIDLRNAPDKVGTELVGARYNCAICHVAPTGAPPLVGNAFGG